MVAGLMGWKMVRPERFELPTYCSGGNRSIHLSYGRARVYYSLHAGVESIINGTLRRMQDA